MKTCIHCHQLKPAADYYTQEQRLHDEIATMEKP